MAKWIFLAVMIVLGFFYWNSKRPGMAFERMAKEMNQRAPMMVAPHTRLDKAELKGKELVMHMSLTDEAPDASSADQQVTKNLLKTHLMKGWCSHEAVRQAIDKGYSMTPIAKRADGSEMIRFTVDRQECSCLEQYAKGDYCVIGR